MKYIEQAKSVILFLLVVTSLVLTFAIWRYTPDYKHIEQTTSKETVASSKKEIIDNIIKPYKVVFRNESNEWTGTINDDFMTDILTMFRDNWEQPSEAQGQKQVSAAEINNITSNKNHMTLFFSGPVPYASFNSTFMMPEPDDAQEEVSEVLFNRMIIDWDSYKDNQLQVYFINTKTRSLYRNYIHTGGMPETINAIIKPKEQLQAYQEIERTDTVSLYVQRDAVEANKYEYYSSETPPERFKDILFDDANVLQSNSTSDSGRELIKYSNGMELMRVDTYAKSLDYVYPRTDRDLLILTPSQLLQETFAFVNEHGGFTSDYRLMTISPNAKEVKYGIYLKGAPVFSDDFDWAMEVRWGNKRVWRYKRPYYSFNTGISEKATDMGKLVSGPEAVQRVQQLNNILLSEVDDVVVGYNLSRDHFARVFRFEPTWFVIYDGNSQALVDEEGGATDGLE